VTGIIPENLVCWMSSKAFADRECATDGTMDELRAATEAQIVD